MKNVFFQETEGHELEFFEASARTGQGVTEVRINLRIYLFIFLKRFVSFYTLAISGKVSIP